MHYEIHGTANTQAVLLSSGLGGAAHYWTPNIPALAAKFRVITYDQQGTGRSPGRLPDGYAIANMAGEVGRLLDQLQVQRCHFIGHALGGLIGLELALSRPDVLDRLVLVNTWAKTHPHTLRCFAARKALLRNTGIAAYVAAQPLFLYPPDWMAERQDWLAQQDEAGVAHFPPEDTVFKRIAAIEAFDVSARLASVHHPALVIASRDDVLVPSRCGDALAEALPAGRLAVMETGGHACNITDTVRFDALVDDFLTAL